MHWYRRDHEFEDRSSLVFFCQAFFSSARECDKLSRDKRLRLSLNMNASACLETGNVTEKFKEQ